MYVLMSNVSGADTPSLGRTSLGLMWMERLGAGRWWRGGGLHRQFFDIIVEMHVGAGSNCGLMDADGGPGYGGLLHYAMCCVLGYLSGSWVHDWMHYVR